MGFRSDFCGHFGTVFQLEAEGRFLCRDCWNTIMDERRERNLKLGSDIFEIYPFPGEWVTIQSDFALED